MVKSRNVVGYENKGDFRGVVLEDVLKMFAEKSMVELIKLPSKKKMDKIAMTSNADLEADKIVHVLIKGKGRLNSPREGKDIFPLYLFLDKEILLYAKLRNLKFKKTIVKLDEISNFIGELEKTHPEVKQAVVGSYLGG